MVDTEPRSGSSTRERILAVALELFAAHGFAATSVRDITDRLGMTKASLYYHFASKEDILRALICPLGEELEALTERTAAGSSVDPRALFTALVDILSRRAAVIRALIADPTGFHKAESHKPGAAKHLTALVDLLAGTDDTDSRLRARCAMGAVQVGVFASLTASKVNAAPPTGELAREILAGLHPVLDQREQAIVVEAALRALGSLGPSRQGATTL